MRLSLRGMGVGIVTDYLAALGEREAEPGLLVGQDWQARISAGAPVQIGAIRLGVTEVVFQGEPAAVSATVAQLERKTLRAGG